MLSFCLKCKKNTDVKKQKASTTKNDKIILFSKHAVCSKTRFIKEQETNGLLG